MLAIIVKTNEKEMNAIDFVFLSGIIKSKSEIRRLIEMNGIEIDGRKVNINQIIKLDKEEFIIKKGKKSFIKVLVQTE